MTIGNYRAAANESRMAVTSIQLEKQRCILWSMAEKYPSCRNDSFTQVSGGQPLPNGERSKWVCKAKRGRKFTEITIGPKTFDLADGRLFLLTGTGSDVKVLQL